MSVLDALPAGLEAVEFFVAGSPVPQGSKNVIHRGGRTFLVDQARKRLNPWREAIVVEAGQAIGEPHAGAVEVELLFTLARPLKHRVGSKVSGELRPDAPTYVVNNPDLDKLTRAALDGLTGAAFADDRQVASLLAAKVYGDEPGVRVRVRGLE